MAPKKKVPISQLNPPGGTLRKISKHGALKYRCVLFMRNKFYNTLDVI